MTLARYRISGDFRYVLTFTFFAIIPHRKISNAQKLYSLLCAFRNCLNCKKKNDAKNYTFSSFLQIFMLRKKTQFYGSYIIKKK